MVGDQAHVSCCLPGLQPAGHTYAPCAVRQPCTVVEVIRAAEGLYWFAQLRLLRQILRKKAVGMLPQEGPQMGSGVEAGEEEGVAEGEVGAGAQGAKPSSRQQTFKWTRRWKALW